MDWLSTFNGFGLAAWLPFTLPRQSFPDVYHKLIAWRNKRLWMLKSWAIHGTTWEFFTSGDPSTIIGEIDVFFRMSNPEAISFARTLMADFQLYAHSLGSIDVYNQGFMSDLHASCWSPGFKRLFDAVKRYLIRTVLSIRGCGREAICTRKDNEYGEIEPRKNLKRSGTLFTAAASAEYAATR